MFGAGWLTIKHRGSNRVEYSVSLVYRMGFGLIAVLLLAALASVAEHPFDRSNTLAYILFAGSLAAALYDERWIFSPEGVEYRVGIVGLAKRRRWLPAQARCLRLVESRQGIGRPMVSLAFLLTDGKPCRIDMARGAAGERLREIANEVSRVSGIPIEK
jgi:hypothetical protein